MELPIHGAVLRAVTLAGAVVLLGGCDRSGPPAAQERPPDPVEVRFADVTEAAGISFRHETGAFGRKWLPETMGSGCAWLDYDLDGRPDLFLVNSAPWPGHRTGRRATQALYRNRGDGTFEDVTARAGLDVELYGMGAAVGDVDNDGDPDLFVNALGADRLFSNRGDGTFEDVTVRAGVSDPGFGSSATFLDYDRDGDLDLFACNYVRWSPETDIFCTLDGVNKSYCTPESYPGATNRLWRNLGGGRFEDVTRPAGVHNDTGKSLGVVVFDHDGDGLQDIAVSNDTQPNYLYRNRGDGAFTEVGRYVGMAFSETGVARAGMGIDAGDYDGCGRESLVITNFSNEMIGLYHNEGPELFVDDAAMAGVGNPSLLTLGFGAFFFDVDLDGWLDLFVANGHVEPDVNRVQKEVAHAQPPHLFRNLGGGRFEDVAPRAGDALRQPLVGRGAAYADYDGDGDLDVAVTTNGGPARLFRNETRPAGRWLRVNLVGTRSPRDAFGARLVLAVGGRRLVRTLRGATSYLSQSEKTVTFGLDGASGADALEIVWPSGARQSLRDLPADRSITIVEGEDGFR